MGHTRCPPSAVAERVILERVNSFHTHPFSITHQMTDRCPALSAHIQIFQRHDPFALAFWMQKWCPLSAATWDVWLFKLHPFFLGHWWMERCPPWTASWRISQSQGNSLFSLNQSCPSSRLLCRKSFRHFPVSLEESVNANILACGPSPRFLHARRCCSIKMQAVWKRFLLHSQIFLNCWQPHSVTERHKLVDSQQYCEWSGHRFVLDVIMEHEEEKSASARVRSEWNLVLRYTGFPSLYR